MIESLRTPAFTLATHTSCTSGVYLALLTNAEMFQNYIVFVVRDDSRVAPLLYQQPVTTYQAYNDYPFDNATGKSLYGYNSYGATTVTGGTNAAKVWFDRPYLGDGTGIDWGASVFSGEINFVRWMEKSGYDVTYSTDIDTHTDGGRLLNYRGFLSVGHDEYWSKPMYDAVIAARDAGVNLAFIGANAVFWQVRFEPSSSGVPNRVLVCYRDATLDPIADPSLKTVYWRDPPVNRPEQTLIGVQYTNGVPWNNGYAPYVVTNSGNWVYAGTGFKDGDSVPGIVGYEADRSFSQYPQANAVSGTYTLLSQSPFPGPSGTADYSNSSVYQAPSGAWVFGAGTSNWSLALDNFSGSNLVDPRIQQTTANILDRFVATQQGDFTITAATSSQTVAEGDGTSYSVTISPTGGFSGKVRLSVSGLASDANGSFTPNPAPASSTIWVTTGASTPTGAYTVTITGVSGSLTHTTTVTLVVNSPPPTAPSSLTATATSSSQINLAWTASSGAVTTYLVERCQTAACSFAPIATVSGTTYSDTTGLAASTSYTYRVQASGPGGLSPYSNTASATTLPPPPTAPSSLAPTSTRLNYSHLYSTYAAFCVTTYLVECCQESVCSNFAQVGTSPSASYSDTGLFASKSYNYRVRASGLGGLSAYSNAASATTHAPPAPTAPSYLPPGDIITTATSFLGAIVTFKVTATDNVDPSPTVRCSPPSGSIFHIGITTVTCTATDRAGNVGSGSFLVTVLRL